MVSWWRNVSGAVRVGVLASLFFCAHASAALATFTAPYDTNLAAEPWTIARYNFAIGSYVWRFNATPAPTWIVKQTNVAVPGARFICRIGSCTSAPVPQFLTSPQYVTVEAPERPLGVPVPDGTAYIAEHPPFPAARCVVTQARCVFTVELPPNQKEWSVFIRSEVGSSPIGTVVWRFVAVGAP